MAELFLHGRKTLTSNRAQRSLGSQRLIITRDRTETPSKNANRPDYLHSAINATALSPPCPNPPHPKSATLALEISSPFAFRTRACCRIPIIKPQKQIPLNLVNPVIMHPGTNFPPERTQSAKSIFSLQLRDCGTMTGPSISSERTPGVKASAHSGPHLARAGASPTMDPNRSTPLFPQLQSS